MRVPRPGRPEWALNETVVEGSDATRAAIDGRIAGIDQSRAATTERRPVACRPMIWFMSTAMPPPSAISLTGLLVGPRSRDQRGQTTSRRWTSSGPRIARRRKGGPSRFDWPSRCGPLDADMRPVPSDLPAAITDSLLIIGCKMRTRRSRHAPVAQLDRASVYGTEG